MTDGNFLSDPGSNPPEGIDAMLQTHGPRIFALAVRLCGNRTDGEDLAQETFVQAFRRRDQFRGEADLGSWIYRICVNLWKNRVRYEKRRFFWQHRPLEIRDADGEVRPMEIADPSDATDAPAELDERQRLVRHALEALEPHERAVIVLRDMEDKSYEEIAAFLELPLGTVKSRIARAREALKEKLEPLLGEQP
ncbi:MAG: sigma-70 family RNA polymerase sigma factor [Elusimicrobia bacterium]|nr:sigma-70 family RNA polymerase sigma factor [Elusimicrobiota bacterium]